MNMENRSDQKRAVILAAALLEFKNRRVDEVKLADIAKRAGVGKGTLYLYFKGKEELFAELAGTGTAEMAERTLEIMSMDGSYRERLGVFVSEFALFAQKQHGWMQMAFRSTSKSLMERVRQTHAKNRAMTLEFLDQGVRAGVLRDDVSLSVLHSLLVGPLFFRQREIQDMKSEIDLEQLMQCFWDAAHRK